MTDWETAVQVFYVGFGGVFLCLLILQALTSVTSRIFAYIESIVNREKS